MTKKITRAEDFISAGDSALLLSAKCGHTIAPDYIRKLKNVRSRRVHSRMTLYHRDDVLACVVKSKKGSE